MGKTYKDSRVTVSHGSVRRQADSCSLAQLVIDLAQAQLEAEAQAEHGQKKVQQQRPPTKLRPKARRRSV